VAVAGKYSRRAKARLPPATTTQLGFRRVASDRKEEAARGGSRGGGHQRDPTSVSHGRGRPLAGSRALRAPPRRPRRERDGESEGKGERGGGEQKRLEGGPGAKYIYVSPDFDEKPGEGDSCTRDPIQRIWTIQWRIRWRKHFGVTWWALPVEEEAIFVGKKNVNFDKFP
jgi:hypothetical protein